MRNIREFEGMTGLDQIVQELNATKTYAIDHRARRGWHQNIVDQLHPKTIDFTVSEIREESPTAKTFRLTPKDGYVPPFRPGQFINIEMEINGIRTTRAYTLSSPVTDRAAYEITVKRAPNAFGSAHMLDVVKLGDTIRSSGPAGTFYRLPIVHGKRLVFIAGGSGITPFLSMLETDADKLDRSYNIDLIYGSTYENDIIAKARLDRLEAEGYVRVHHVISKPETDCKYRTGFITGELISEIAGDVKDCTFYLCGPNVMYHFVRAELEKLGVPRRSIRQEVEVIPADPTAFPGWPESITDDSVFTITLADGRRIEARATETIMNTLEKAGVVIPSLCRSGECSTCRTKLTAGTVFHPGTELLRKADMRFGYIHPCVTYPISDITLQLP